MKRCTNNVVKKATEVADVRRFDPLIAVIAFIRRPEVL